MISIVVPVYKSERTLHRCVDSLLRQTYGDIEVLLVVDGSPDHSAEICEEYAVKDARVRVLYRHNEGVSQARNRGVQAAGGEYICFVDSDDFIEANTCGRMLEIMDAECSDLVIAGFHHIYLGRDVKKCPREEKTYTRQTFPSAFLDLYEDGFLNMPWNKLFKKSLIREGFPHDLNLGEDLLFNLAYLQQAPRITVTREMFCHYIQEDKKNTLSTRRRADKLEIASRICDRTKAFYRELAGPEADCTRIDGKFVKEFLDEVEGLAFDDDLTKAEKKQLITSYSRNAYMQAANGPDLWLPALDYRIINHFFRQGNTEAVYVLIYLRKMVVQLVRKIRG